MLLKDYQQRSIDELRSYLADLTALDQLRTDPAKLAFIDRTGRPYKTVSGLEGIPYICLRLPTGGGKTLLACHAIAVAGTEYIAKETVLALWLVPTKTILTQTLDALRNREHPYRQVLDVAFNGEVRAIDLEQALRLTRSELDGSTIVIVSTLQALRVQDTVGRKIYEQNGSLMAHFDGLNPRALDGLERYLESTKIKPSLANVLQLRRPLVIMDEAHNARTKLSFETLTRFRPAAIIEFTATPELEDDPESGRYASNVLYQVSASELKVEEMIRLPIKLRTTPRWEEAVQLSVQQQRHLEKDALEQQSLTGEYIRPIVLLQAQPKDESITVERIRQCLFETGVPEPEIVVATGTERGLSGIDLLADTCPIRFIITIDALKEGWDCPFAYVLCTVAELSAVKSVEQIVGRIMRMPGAKRKQVESLNCSYVFTSSPRFNETLTRLRDSLVENGFERIEANEFAQPQQPGFGFGPLDAGPPPLTDSQAELSSFAVPLLTYEEGGSVDLFENDLLLPAEWNIAVANVELTETDYTPAPPATAAMIDIEKGKLVSQVEHLHQQMKLLEITTGFSLAALANWIDRNFAHSETPQSISSVWISQQLEKLMFQRKLTLDELARDRYRLLAAFREKYRRAIAEQKDKGLQTLLLGEGEGRLSVSPSFEIVFDPRNYSPSQLCEVFRFKKHFHPNLVGAMNNEEIACAQFIDGLEDVVVWVRNLERDSRAFWLPTPSDKFYPDFVAKLIDDRILVVEYKGEDRWSNDDSKEKRMIGDLWADRSNGLFVMPKGKDWNAITANI